MPSQVSPSGYGRPGRIVLAISLARTYCFDALCSARAVLPCHFRFWRAAGWSKVVWMKRRCFSWVLISSAILLTSANLPAQSTGTAMPAMDEMHTVPPPEQLPSPIRMAGIGNSHITVKATPEAQAWFDQGLTLMHDFWDYESARAFQQGIRSDPNCAMC